MQDDPKPVRLSRRLLAAIKLAPVPAYRIAQQARVNPGTLSRLMHGAQPVLPQDARVLRVARVLGVAEEEAFE